MRRNNLEPLKEIPIYSVWIKKSAEIDRILKADTLYIDASMHRANACNVHLSDEPYRYQQTRTSVRILQLESTEEYDLARGWVSQPEISMLCSLLTFKGYEVMINMNVFDRGDGIKYVSFSDKLSEMIEQNRRPDPFKGAGAFFDDPIRVIRKKPPHEMMKKFDPKSLDT